jgi:hypothetical protein
MDEAMTAFAGRRGACAVALARLAVVFAFLMASVTVGALARVPLATDPGLAAFFAAGGTPADLCGGGQDHVGGAHCDGCRPIGAAPVPLPLAAGPLRIALPTRMALPRAEVASRRDEVVRPGRPRGPPVLS